MCVWVIINLQFDLFFFSRAIEHTISVFGRNFLFSVTFLNSQLILIFRWQFKISESNAIKPFAETVWHGTLYCEILFLLVIVQHIFFIQGISRIFSIGYKVWGCESWSRFSQLGSPRIYHQSCTSGTHGTNYRYVTVIIFRNKWLSCSFSSLRNIPKDLFFSSKCRKVESIRTKCRTYAISSSNCWYLLPSLW